MPFPERTNHSILVVGCGSIGRRHIGNLQSLGVDRIAACDTDPDQLAQAASKFGVSGYGSLEEALDAAAPDAVVVCTPPLLHVLQAFEAVRAGAHVFLEKPLSHSLDGVDALIREAATAQRIIQVGYNFRFHKGLRIIKGMLDRDVIGRVLWARAELGQYLPDWRPTQDYRRSYTAHRSQGGGIILDGSHEIDYMRWFFGEVERVYCLADTLSSLDVDAEDTACMTLRFKSGCVGQIHVDFVQRARARNCKIVGTEGTILWDNWDASVQVFAAETNGWDRIEVPGDTNDKYLTEMESFLSCLDGTRQPEVDAQSARQTLEVALAAHESARTGREVSIPYQEGGSG